MQDTKPTTRVHRPPEVVVIGAHDGDGADPTDSRGVALATIAPEATEREVRKLVEGLRSQGVEVSVYDVIKTPS